MLLPHRLIGRHDSAPLQLLPQRGKDMAFRADSREPPGPQELVPHREVVDVPGDGGGEAAGRAEVQCGCVGVWMCGCRFIFTPTLPYSHTPTLRIPVV